MNYSEMSDFEINRKVLAIISGIKPLGYAHNADKRSAGLVKSNQYHWYDYCNSWSDAGPIIQQYRISISFDESDDGDEYSEWVAACSLDEEHFVDYQHCDKALRAAMIVFLMMQEQPDAA